MTSRFHGNQYVKANKFSIASTTQASVYLLSTVMAVTALIGMYRENSWRNQVVEPCSFGCVQAIEPKTTPSPSRKPQTHEELVKASKHPEEIMHIWEKETTFGRNKNPQALHNICKSQGKSNEFGYGGMAMKICFDTFEEAVKTVDEWLTKRDKENLCYYNIGVKTSDCNYVK